MQMEKFPGIYLRIKYNFAKKNNEKFIIAKNNLTLYRTKKIYEILSWTKINRLL